VHTSFNQAVAATGRLSSQNPNLQNIPIRTDKGREIRKAFITGDKDFTLMAADYSQIELRIIAAISGDRSMIDDFVQGHDIHSSTAAKVFGVPINEVDKEMRRKAKMVNFGIIYGISAFGLAQRLEISRKEAAAIIESYFKQYPDIRRYMNDTIDFARNHGYVETVMGRRRYIRDINSRNQTIRGFAERNAINAPIQGSAADMIKIAMINIHRDVKRLGLKSKMILQVHDELLFEAHSSERDRLKELVEEKMLNAISLKVPLEVQVGFGDNWLEAH
jgi:DNA polymerase-1